ncbi:MAG: flagellar biosynthesis protein FlhB [Betaproteobacteria bacterium]|nr:flagellar biosynthesis protein FlhB [Betaproteobacteria bacterium]
MSRRLREGLEAVALEYGQNSAPVVVAKASDELAERLIAEAERQGVYVTRDPQLLALLSELEVDQEIPERLYTAVAIILSWAYWLRGLQPGDEKR